MKRVKKPWGYFDLLALNEKSTVKVISIDPKEEISLQKHEMRDETWLVVDGDCLVTVEGEVKRGCKGDVFEIKAGSEHKAEAGNEGVRILEISRGEFKEEDVVRLSDKYKRG